MAVITMTASSEEATNNNDHRNNNKQNNDSVITKTLFLIRHGEACHNVQEKLAKQLALQQALEDGLDANDEETRRRMEESRQAILDDPQFFDAPLSQRGQEQAEQAAVELKRICAENGFEEPEEVLVSPLERTLKTAATIFPQHTNVRVREELRERLTGRPADYHAPSSQMARRKSFTNFSFQQQLGSFVAMQASESTSMSTPSDDGSISRDSNNSDDEDNNKGGGGGGVSSSFRRGGAEQDSVRSVESVTDPAISDREERQFRRDLIECTLGDRHSSSDGSSGDTDDSSGIGSRTITSSTSSSDRSSSASSSSVLFGNQETEDEEQLCLRTKRLFKMLAHSKADSIARTF